MWAGRITGGLIALAVLVVGVLPTAGGYRCSAVSRAPTIAPHDCCPKDEQATTIGTPCCERVAARTMDARTSDGRSDCDLLVPSFTSSVVLAFHQPSLPPAGCIGLPTARGQPPGPPLHALSSVLRI